jgi:hypothetical protein
MKNGAITLLLVSLLSAALLAGCTQQQPQSPNQSPAQNPPANNTGPLNSPKSITMDKLYRYDSVKSYEYKAAFISGNSTTTGDMKFAVSSDTINGTAAWLQRIDLTAQGTTVASKIWLDKVTFNCLSAATLMNWSGNITEQTTPCTSQVAASTTLNYIGTESLTVPAGTFTADEYSYNQTTYWATASVPVPLKISSAGTMIELVRYT